MDDLKELPGFEQLPENMRSVLDDFDADAKRILNAELGSTQIDQPPKTMYHYTDDHGLKGILESGKLWLTDVFSLNDPSEQVHAFQLAVAILNERTEKGPPEAKIFARQFAAFLDQGSIRHVAYHFVCAFSAADDDLGQWRAYADDGRGYAIGFNGKILDEGFLSEGDPPIRVNGGFRVKYDDAQISRIQQQLIDKVFPLISQLRGRDMLKPQIRVYMTELQMRLTYHVLHTTLYFKHEAYANEREYRLLQIHRGDLPRPEVKVRMRPYMLIQYREFNWRKYSPNALSEIIIGPSADTVKAAQFARDCLDLYKHGTVKIRRSAIPYRAKR